MATLVPIGAHVVITLKHPLVDGDGQAWLEVNGIVKGTDSNGIGIRLNQRTTVFVPWESCNITVVTDADVFIAPCA